jgi:hypothetical protein
MLVCWVYCEYYKVVWNVVMLVYFASFTLFSLLEIWNVDPVVVWLLELATLECWYVRMLVGFIGMWWLHLL